MHIVLENFCKFLVFLVFGIIIYAMGRSLLVSKNKAEKSAQMLLPHDFFISLMLCFSLWALIFLLYATSKSLGPLKEMVVIISSFLCPFLFWWNKKQCGSKN